MKVYLLASGSLVIDHSHMFWNIGCGTPVRFPVYSILVDHPEGLILIDTGYDLEHVQRVLPFELPEQQPSETIPEQLKLIGYTPDDVKVLINSHLHFDHVGGNRFITKARTVLHKKELEEGYNPQPFEGLGYSDKQWDHPAANFETIEGDIEFARGIHLFETPGHTIGHYSVLVERSGDRPMLFTIDATYTRENYDKELNSGFHIDPVAGLQSIRRLKQLQQQYDADLFFSHDAEAYKTYKVAPEYYEG